MSHSDVAPAGEPVLAFQNLIRAEVRKLQAKRAEEKREKAAADTFVETARKGAEKVLQGRNILASVSNCSWRKVEHTCPTLAGVCGCKDAEEENGQLGSLSVLSAAWERRHAGVFAAPAKIARTERKQHPCYLQGHCTCGASHKDARSCLASMLRVMKALFKKDDVKLLTQGSVVLAWVSPQIEDEAGPVLVQYCYVALQYLSPYRPTFLCLRALGQEGQQDGDLLGVHDKLLHRHPDAEPLALRMEMIIKASACETEMWEPHLKTPQEFVSELDLSRSWYLRTLLLSERCRPAVLGPGEVVAIVASSGDDASLVWDHEQRGRPRRQGPAALDIYLASGSFPQEGDNERDGGQNFEGDEAEDTDAEIQIGGEGSTEQSERPVGDHDEWWAPDLLQLFQELEMMRSTDGEDAGVAVAGESDSSTSSSSSRSSSSSSQQVAPDVPAAVDNDPPIVPQPAVAARPAQGLLRQRQEATFQWGKFLFTFRPPRSYQATCRVHLQDPSGAKCTKSSSWNTPEEREQVIRKLKSWCLCAASFPSKLEHQGRRGVLEESPAHRELSEDELLRLQDTLPDLAW